LAFVADVDADGEADSHPRAVLRRVVGFLEHAAASDDGSRL
jgi:hypothetical protein